MFPKVCTCAQNFYCARRGCTDFLLCTEISEQKIFHKKMVRFRIFWHILVCHPNSAPCCNFGWRLFRSMSQCCLDCAVNPPKEATPGARTWAAWPTAGKPIRWATQAPACLVIQEYICSTIATFLSCFTSAAAKICRWLVSNWPHRDHRSIDLDRSSIEVLVQHDIWSYLYR